MTCHSLLTQQIFELLTRHYLNHRGILNDRLDIPYNGDDYTFWATLYRAPRGPSRGPPLETFALLLGNRPSDAWLDPAALNVRLLGYEM